MGDRYAGYKSRLDRIKNRNRFRVLNRIDARQGKTITLNGRSCLNLSSNDYLGLATDEGLIRRFYSRMDDENRLSDFGPGASSSRLLAGNFSLYQTLEAYLKALYQGREVLVFNSGYHANIGMIPVLAGEKDLILSDSLNHASMVDGIRLSKAACMIFAHNDLNALEDILKKERGRFNRVLIVTESVFSMDGDLADLSELVRLKNRYEAFLYVDEAHSVGVYGENGLGLCEETGTINDIDVILGTCGKALASHGAYAVTNGVVRDICINGMRSLLYTTALPPVAVNWNLFLMKQLPSFHDRRKALRAVSGRFRRALAEARLTTPGQSHIIPVLTCDNQRAVMLSNALFEAGFLAYPIRPPTVPENRSRIRISLTSDIGIEEIRPLAALMKAELEKSYA